MIERPTLTILGGPMAGQKFVVAEAVDNVLIGSDPSCGFCITLPGVSPIHARLWVDAQGVTVYDANSPRGLYINDDRVVGQSPLRNGDILWLGAPGDEDVVMIQCRVPRLTTPVASSAPTPVPGGEETMLLGAMARAAAAAPPPPPAEAGSDFDVVVPEETMALPPPAAEAAAQPAVAPQPVEPAFAGPDEPAATMVIHESEVAAAAPEPAAPASDFDLVAEPSGFQMAPEASPGDFAPAETTVLTAPDEHPHFVLEPGPSSAPPHFEDETVSDVPLPAVPPPAPAPVEEGETVFVTPPPPPPPAPAPAPPAPPPAAKPAAAAPPPAPRPKPPAPAPRAAERPSGPRAAAPVAKAAPAPPPAKSATPVGLYAGIAAAVVVVLLGGGFALWKFVLAKPTGDGSTAGTVPVAATTAPTAATLPPTTVAAATPVPTPEATPPVEEGVTTVKPSPSAAPSAAPSATPPTKVADKLPTPAPPTPAPAKPTPAAGKATPPPPTQPSAEVLKAQQVADLLGQADSALAARKYEAAGALYDEALKLDPANDRAKTGRTTALAGAAVLRKTFVAGRTSVQGGKAAKGGVSGFDSEDVSVAKAPDYSGRIEFEASPAHVKAGDNYAVKIYLVNDGKKAFKIGGLTISTVVNGTRAGGGPAAPPTSEVASQQRVLLQEVPGVWPDTVNSWALEVVVTSNHGDTFKNQLSWR